MGLSKKGVCYIHRVLGFPTKEIANLCCGKARIILRENKRW